MRLGRSNDPQAVEAAKQAVAYLKSDPELSRLLSEGFMSLREGQGEILTSINRLEKLMTAQHDEQMRLLTEMSGQLTAMGGLPKRLEVSDEVERLFLISKVSARHGGRDFDENIARFAATLSGFGLFTMRVLEEGRAFVRYETRIANAMWYATPTASFIDNKGRRYRKITTDVPVWGKPGKRFSLHSIDCNVKGFWRTIERLEEREYMQQ